MARSVDTNSAALLLINYKFLIHKNVNRIQYAQGGFPLSIERMEDMQECWALIGQLAQMIGTTVVVSGCEVSGTQVASGYVVINGELLPFEGGTAQTYVRVEETTETLEYKDGNTHPYLTRRKAVFSSVATTGAVRWADFLRGADTIQTLQTRVTPAQLNAEVNTINNNYGPAINALQEAIEALGGNVSGQITQQNTNLVPKYTIIPYGKSINLKQTTLDGVLGAIPYGYVPCGDIQVTRDSSWTAVVAAWNAYLVRLGLSSSLSAGDTANGKGVLSFATRLDLPNLVDRFVVAAGGEYISGDIGGYNKVALEADELPSHKHSFKDYYHAEAYDTIKNESYSGASVVRMPGSVTHYGAGKTDDDASAWLAYIHSTENAGGNVAHENRPPYFALLYLIKMI